MRAYLCRNRVSAAVFLLAIPLCGCEPPLAAQDSYFVRDWSRGPAPSVAAETLGTARHLQAVHEVLRRCHAPGGASEGPPGADLGAAAGEAALAELCGAAADRATAAAGATANAYRRWLEDQVHELPEASAARAGGN